jgi:predicted transcriptional regulator
LKELDRVLKVDNKAIDTKANEDKKEVKAIFDFKQDSISNRIKNLEEEIEQQNEDKKYILTQLAKEEVKREELLIEAKKLQATEKVKK